MISDQELEALFAYPAASSFEDTGVTLKAAIWSAKQTQCTDQLTNGTPYKVLVGAAPAEIPTDGVTRYVDAEAATVDLSLGTRGPRHTAWAFRRMKFQSAYSYVDRPEMREGDAVDVDLIAPHSGSDELVTEFRIHDPRWATNTRPKLQYRFRF